MQFCLSIPPGEHKVLAGDFVEACCTSGYRYYTVLTWHGGGSGYRLAIAGGEGPITVVAGDSEEVAVGSGAGATKRFREWCFTYRKRGEVHGTVAARPCIGVIGLVGGKVRKTPLVGSGIYL